MFDSCILLHNRATKYSQTVPENFCWTRFGTEAGQPVSRIVERKERERRANHGVFLWGIGNSVGAGIKELVGCCNEPEVLFSPIKGPPRLTDTQPAAVITWSVGETLEGHPYTLPRWSMVTSRASATRSTHYALVCFSTRPIELVPDGPRLALSGLRNLISGRPVGASQVTAVVRRRINELDDEAGYAVAFRARLTYPYFVRLACPAPLETNLHEYE